MKRVKIEKLKSKILKTIIFILLGKETQNKENQKHKSKKRNI